MRQWDALKASVKTMRSNSTDDSMEFAFGLVVDEMTTIELAGPQSVNGTADGRACFFCGKVLSALAGFIETISQPDGNRRDFCSMECLHWQVHEDGKL